MKNGVHGLIAMSFSPLAKKLTDCCYFLSARYGNQNRLLTNCLDLQDVNTNNPNITVPIMDDHKNGMQDNMCRATGSEVKAGVDLCGNGKTDTSSVHILGYDSKFSNTSLPLRKTPHGIFDFLALNTLMEICLLLRLIKILLTFVFIYFILFVDPLIGGTDIFILLDFSLLQLLGE